MSFTIFGAPRTKKNSPTMTFRGKPRLIPSKAWSKWVASSYFAKDGQTIRPPRAGCGEFNVTAIFYRDARRGDAVGYYQGLADLLEKRGVVENDRQLVSWNGSILSVDRTNPRVEVTLTAV